MRANSQGSEIFSNPPALQGMVWGAMGTTDMSTEITSKDAAMTKVINQVGPDRFLLHLRPVIELTDDQLYELCQINQELWIERTAEGDLETISITDEPCPAPHPN